MMHGSSSFDIRPYQGVGPLSFGMTRDGVHAELGPPLRSFRNHLGEQEELWDEIKISYATPTQSVVEAQLMPPGAALFDGVDLLRLADPVAALMAYDPNPLESVGIVLFLKLGIALTGFEAPEDESDKAVGVFAQDRWLGHLSRFRPLRRSSA